MDDRVIITSAAVFRGKDKLHPAATIRRLAGGAYGVFPEPGRRVKGKVVEMATHDPNGAAYDTPREKPIRFATFDEAVAAVGD